MFDIHVIYLYIYIHIQTSQRPCGQGEKRSKKISPISPHPESSHLLDLPRSHLRHLSLWISGCLCEPGATAEALEAAAKMSKDVESHRQKRWKMSSWSIDGTIDVNMMSPDLHQVLHPPLSGSAKSEYRRERPADPGRCRSARVGSGWSSSDDHRDLGRTSRTHQIHQAL